MTDPTINRRELIKLLAASGVAITTAGFVQSRWTKPTVKIGVLPAHAQASTTHTLLAGEGCFVPCSSGSMTSIVTIDLPDAGISMSFSIVANAPAVLSSAASGTATTNSSGVAQTILTGYSPGGGSIIVTWSFADSRYGTDTSDEYFINTGC